MREHIENTDKYDETDSHRNSQALLNRDWVRTPPEEVTHTLTAGALCDWKRLRTWAPTHDTRVASGLRVALREDSALLRALLKKGTDTDTLQVDWYSGTGTRTAFERCG